ncbi:PLP-dependent aminotransferase family protein [Lacimicrobium alkaliphilum]|uniref:HTH gntR-type domain-containing protein n=1 Tax=Lacimicrobium alkaliphilum TaxID=1526571 RepID=A0A0U3B640_9ALTE|nr:PLP-dependent aminotransferase family protein [Lacimicrobium alkaliphilum]ALS97141.1 hypothetical protein AT746_01835 [Lacimicrobium alkaliphilum]
MTKLTDPIFEVDLNLRGSDAGSLVETLSEQLKQAIDQGRLQPEFRLPPTRTLATRIGVSRNTVLAAYEALRSLGYLDSRRGSGTFVAARPVELKTEATNRLSLKKHLHPYWRERQPFPGHAQQARTEFDFSVGKADISDFPFAEWRRHLHRAVHKMQRVLTESIPDPQGQASLRQSISRHLSFSRALACEAEDLVVTNGVAQAVELLIRLFVRPGQTRVAIEHPGYFKTRQAFEAAGAIVVEVEVDENGMQVDAIPADVDLVCVTPSHQFPLGVALSRARRKALLRRAEAEDMLILEDDYDCDFRLGERPIDALKTQDLSQRVFYLGTFSKNMFPDVRIGYVLCPEWARTSLVAARNASDWHSPVMVQEALADFIEQGCLFRHVTRMRKRYAERDRILRQALSHFFPARITVPETYAGLHLTVLFDQHVDVQKLKQRALARGLNFFTLNELSPQSSGFNAIVLGYGCIEKQDIEPGIRLLAECMAD